MGKYDRQIQEDIVAAEEKEKRVRKSLTRCKNEIERLLKMEDYSKVLELFQTEEIQELARIDISFANMSVILSIYHMELEEGVEEGILAGIHDMHSAEEKYLRIKFLLWRLEFTEDIMELEKQLQQKRISVPFLKYLIHTSSFSKADTAYKLAMLLKRQDQYINAFSMLRYVGELSPNEEVVFCEMADICVRMKQYEMADSCIQQIKNPTAILERYQKKWEEQPDE